MPILGPKRDISALPANQIPEEWDKDWFLTLLTTWLVKGDYRNIITPQTSVPIVTGSRGGNAALASLISALAAYGLVVDNTTA